MRQIGRKSARDLRPACQKHQSFDAAGAVGAPGAGASWVGAAARLGAAGFLAAASGAPAAGRGDGNGAAAPGDAGGRGADAVVPGSGVMMLTGGVEAAEGKSALVGLPVGIVGGSAARGVDVTGAFHTNV